MRHSDIKYSKIFSTLAGRWDLHYSMVNYNIEKVLRLDLCLAEYQCKPSSKRPVLNCICDKYRGHSGMHEDIDGGIWWR